MINGAPVHIGYLGVQNQGRYYLVDDGKEKLYLRHEILLAE